MQFGELYACKVHVRLILVMGIFSQSGGGGIFRTAIPAGMDEIGLKVMWRIPRQAGPVTIVPIITRHFEYGWVR